jgi:hypothetical protein
MSEAIIQDQQTGLGQRTKQGEERAVVSGQGEGMQQAGGAIVTHGETMVGSGLAKGGNQKRFSRADRTEDQQVVTGGDLLTLGEFEDGATIQAVRGSKIEIFEGSLHEKGGQLDVALNAVFPASDTFLVHQERQTIFKSYRSGRWSGSKNLLLSVAEFHEPCALVVAPRSCMPPLFLSRQDILFHECSSVFPPLIHCAAWTGLCK